jgi:hypothetical protein
MNKRIFTWRATALPIAASLVLTACGGGGTGIPQGAAPSTTTQTGNQSKPHTLALTNGTVVWQAGDPILGQWIAGNTGQCGSPVQSASQITFTLQQQGTDCTRNQLTPLNADSTMSTLSPGHTYAWTFTYIDGTPSDAPPGMGPDADARSLIWQIHTSQGWTNKNCMQLGFWNNEQPGTAQQWYFYGTCDGDSAAFSMPYTPQETDSFEIDAYICDCASGYTTLYRNGVLVGTITGPNFNDDPGVDPWWNFGPYKWRWELSDGGGSNMSSVGCTIQNMTLAEQQ